MQPWQSQPLRVEHSRVSTGRYARHVLSRIVGHYWMWLALPLVVCILLGVLRWEWLVVALMYVFIIIPMLMPLAYYWCMLTPETRWSLLPKTVEISDDGISLTFDDGAYPGQKHIGWNEVSACTQQGTVLIFTLTVRKFQYLMVETKPVVVETKPDENKSGGNEA